MKPADIDALVAEAQMGTGQRSRLDLLLPRLPEAERERWVHYLHMSPEDLPHAQLERAFAAAGHDGISAATVRQWRKKNPPT